MAKRANPFSEDFVQQSKIHVGLKQFNNNNDRLEKVYKRTLEILFKGAKKAQPDSIKAAIEINSKKDGLKQLFLTADGSLSHSGKMKELSSSYKCPCGSDALEHCAYCAERLCSSCEHGCTKCGYTFCSSCVIFENEKSEVCKSCYGHVD